LVEISGRGRKCPVERKVGDLFPAILATGVVAPSGEQLVCRDRLGVLDVLLEILALHSRGQDVVFTASNEQQWCTVVLAKLYAVAACGVKFAKPPWNRIRPDTGTA
jgi:hypothetical protein